MTDYHWAASCLFSVRAGPHNCSCFDSVMAGDNKPTAQPEPPSSASSASAETAPTVPPPQTEAPASIDRAELLRRGRAFLTSPQFRYEGVSVKRKFLAEKGLTDVEIDGLLHEAVSPPTSVHVSLR